jgi:hypothetical protein
MLKDIACTDTASSFAPDATQASDLLEHQHKRLARWNRTRFDPAFPEDFSLEDHDIRALERRVVERARAKVRARAAQAPTDPEAFLRWFEALAETGPGQGDPLFPFLADHARYDQMRWFIEQEAAGEAGFEDLVAMTQVKLSPRAKLELARNYWDEMGRGNAKGMHGPMLADLAGELEVTPTIETTVWQSLALANTMAALASNRCYAFHSVGALGVIELTAPTRAGHVAQGLQRLGVAGRARHYFELHAVLDVRHAAAWNKEAIAPLVAEDPRRATAIAEGALMRLECGLACFEVYRGTLCR